MSVDGVDEETVDAYYLLNITWSQPYHIHHTTNMAMQMQDKGVVDKITENYKINK